MPAGNPDAEGLPITQLLADWHGGRNEALRELLPLVYNRLLQVAQSFMRRERSGHTLQPTALVGELYLRLASATSPDLKSREHFYSFCARTMRWILTDHARRREAEKRQAHLQLPLTDDIPWLGARPSDTLDLDRALSKLAEIDARAAHIVELRIYLGCTAEEAASILNISKPTVDRSLTMARAWLCRELRPDEDFHQLSADAAP
jgi:RNA polymerase sigma factor (TIGR02999 family)